MEFRPDQHPLVRARRLGGSRLMGLAMAGVFLVAVGVSVGASTAIAAAPERTIVGFIIGAFVMAVVLLIIYRYVPNRKSRFSELWPGALTAGVCIELLNFAFPTYVQLTHGVATYGRSFGFLFILGTWTYFLSMFLLFGAVMN